LNLSSFFCIARGERAFALLGKFAWLLVFFVGGVALFQVLGDFVPRPVQPPLRFQSDAVQTAGRIATVGHFPHGGAAGRKPVGSEFELLGVLSGGDAGAAILRRKGDVRSMVITSDTDIPGGARLVRIDSDAVTLLQGVVETRLVLKRALPASTPGLRGNPPGR